MTFDELIQLAREQSKEIQRDKGTLFEKIAQIYFKNEPTYKNLFSDVWLLNEVPEEYAIPKKDTGVDLVARNEATGELTAIQAKFYDNKIYKRHIDSFLAELGKSYYSDGIIVYSLDSLSSNADEAINQLSKPVAQIGLSDLRNSQVDWESFIPSRPNEVKVKNVKKTRPYQNEAIDLTIEYFKENDRGQLIMAPGTGKTFTSLKLVEKMAKQTNKETFNVLYLVPSIQLLSQTLIGWNNDTELSMHSFAVTSDRNASKKKNADELSAKDIGFPATTDSDKLLSNYKKIENSQRDLTVVYSTYQSIEVLHEAQEKGFPEFDIVICDEAHRTTGAKALGEEASVFTRVHNNNYIKASKRLYQTATPKIYGTDAKQKAEDSSIVLSSMDNKDIYGEEIFRLGFGQAVSNDILTDYKVMVLAVDEKVIQKDMQRVLSDSENGLDIDDVSKLIGVWNGLMKRSSVDKDAVFEGKPMQRAISFINTINNSKKISSQFNEVVNEYLDGNESIQQSINVRHVDGMMNTLEKKEALDWLSEDFAEDETRVLSNVKFLTEGIDVPNLDAVIFLAPKKSQVDIVQAVGRIMRKFKDKEYGYIILPIVIPEGTTPESILDNNKKYEAVWQILNALRSVDERFSAMINKLELNRKKPENMDVIGIGEAPSDEEVGNASIIGDRDENVYQTSLDLDWGEIENAIYAKVVKKVGDRRYLEDWSEDVAKIAQRHIEQITIMISDKNSQTAIEFDKFLKSLQHNINESIDEKQAIEMLAQHLITAPIFEALFGEYSFVNNNPVSEAMDKIVEELSRFGGFNKEQDELKDFYDSVKLRAEGIDNAEAKQRIITTLYENFFKKGFNDTTKKMGIVFTPVEIVDFIVKSVDVLLKKHFGKAIEDEGVHILDPFTGTGTFIVRTLHYLKDKLVNGEITLADITRKYTQELHANEIVLLSYYIAAINIESTFAEINHEEYKPFEGIVLTDTFESTEQEDTLDDSFFGTNDERLKRQKEVQITAIMGNPPYSSKQENEDENFSRISYPLLDSSLRSLWVETSSATNKNGLFDSYIRAIRWSANQLDKNGIIGFITNSSFIDGNAMDGLRKSLLKEFSDIYVIDLKGQIRRRSKEQVKIEGGNVFDIMTGVAITILIKDEKRIGEGNLRYLNIGNGLKKADKLSKISGWDSISNIFNKFDNILPNEKGDWINQRDSNFDSLVEIGNKKSKDALLIDYTGGIKTGRDAWSWGFQKENITTKIKESIKYYEENIGNIDVYSQTTNKISWTSSLKKQFEKGQQIVYEEDRIFVGMYRPFTKKYVYYSKALVDRQYQMPKVFPNKNAKNSLIAISNKTEGKKFTSLFIDVLPDVNLFAGGSQNLPQLLFDNMGGYSAVRTDILKRFDDLSEEDLFYYIYGIFHSKDYEKTYHQDLSKSFPRLPNVSNKTDFIEIGKRLAYLHLNYEKIPAYEAVEIVYKTDNPSFKVNKKMKHPKRGQLDTIIFNEDIIIKSIPVKAYEYVVNGKPAIEWIIDQYQVKDRESGIVDDPNGFSDDPKYILNLLLSIINVSMQTMDLVESLPPLEVID
ncbi:DEAD/DEAH box helicase [Enterococcus faecalis]|uniref:DEAD/DEAH box helicase n=1 Tax=Enterococcus faecalis TaxID=1351 RepID=UPI00288F9B79|nr:type ISP restriction/modification enzyme [Enterococcus faecalis]MDT2093746.1 DEAD/DEAH box helicase family protein [Enterococcus faecalis]